MHGSLMNPPSHVYLKEIPTFARTPLSCHARCRYDNVMIGRRLEPPYAPGGAWVVTGMVWRSYLPCLVHGKRQEKPTFCNEPCRL